jgi:long-chain acyl-CoA synthetase
MTTLADLWQDTEHRHADQIAVIAAEHQMTYRQLGDRIRRVAAGLSSRWGIQPGDIVALLTPNCIEFVISYFAIVQIGVTVQPVDERITPEEIAAVLADADTRFLIVHGSLWPKFEQIRTLTRIERVLGRCNALNTRIRRRHKHGRTQGNRPSGTQCE